jgi:Glycosyl hydrolases family 43
MAFGGSYYAYGTSAEGDNVPSATSPDTTSWTRGNDTMPYLPLWAVPGRTWGPTVAPNASGQFVMFLANEDRAFQTECIGRAVSASPTGHFTDFNAQPVICDPSLGGDIDPAIFTDAGGQSYLLWKTDGNSIGVATGIWSEPLDSTLNVIGSPTLLMVDDQGWQGGIIEAPNMVLSGGQYYLFYGGGSYAGASYAIGVAQCAGPAGPCQDGGSNPVLISAAGMTGPGGPSFFQSSGGQLLMAFAAWPGAVGYGYGGYRAMYLATVSFDGGVPVIRPANNPPPTQGYWEVATDGGIFSFGTANYYGSMGGQALNAPIVSMASTSDKKGYWLVAADGGIFCFGDAGFYGSEGGQPLNQPIVGMAATSDGKGYWLVARDGGVFAFGDAGFQGSEGGQALNAPMVGIAADTTTGGYWEVGADGGIFTFGAPYLGSTGGTHLNEPIVGIASAAGRSGYWFVAADGGVFAYGDAPFHGSMGGQPLNRPVVGMATTADGNGYRLIASDGGIFAFGDADFDYSMGGLPLNAPMVGMATS